MFSNIGGGELLLIALVGLLLFGPKKLPELFQSFGKGMRSFKKAIQDVEDEIKDSVDIDKDIKK